MIRSMSTRDSSLSLRMTCRVVFCHCSLANPPSLSFWTSFWARKNPCYVGKGLSSENFIAFQTWFVQWMRGILRYRSEWHAGLFLSLFTSQSSFFVILNESILLLCHSERAFERGRIPKAWVKDRIGVIVLVCHYSRVNPLSLSF